MFRSFFEKYATKSMGKIEVDESLKHHLAEQLFQKPARKSFLSFILNTMKRYSFPVLATLTVFVFVLTSVIKTPLEPQEVLAKALENYEQQANGIHHEKRLEEMYHNGKFIFSTLTESYQDEMGNSLFIQINPKTEEIESVDLTQIDEFGDGSNYTSSFQEDFFASLTSEEKKELDRLKGEKIYCVEKLEYKGERIELELFLAKKDHSAHQIRWSGVPKKTHDPSVYKQDIDALFSLQGSSKLGPVDGGGYIQALIQTNSYDYSQIQEGSKTYYLFKVPLYLNDSETWFYIDSQTYQLSGYEIYTKTKSIQEKQKVTFLINEFIDESERSTLFNPNRFELLKGIEPIPQGYVRPFKVESSACFDYQGNPLPKDFFNGLSEEIKTSWNRTMNDIQLTMESSDEKDMELNVDGTLTHMPAQGYCTQGYKNDHLGWDLAPKEDGDLSVYAALAGEVIQVNVGDWNNGYGNMVMIDHGDDLQTLYAHLNEVSVQVGQTLSAGEKMGTIGNTGKVVDGSYLYFEVRKNGKKIDPKWLFE